MSRPFPRSITASAFLSALLLGGCRPDVLIKVERERPQDVVDVWFCNEPECTTVRGELVTPFDETSTELVSNIGVSFDASGPRTLGMIWNGRGQFCRRWRLDYEEGPLEITANVSCAGVHLLCEGAVCTELGECDCDGCDGCF